MAIYREGMFADMCDSSKTYTVEEMKDVGFQFVFENGDPWVGSNYGIEDVDGCSFVRPGTFR